MSHTFIRVCKSEMNKRMCPLFQESLKSRGRDGFGILYCKKHSERGKHVGDGRITEGSLNQSGVGEGRVLKNERGGK